jgi:NADPH-dependent 2,4-dienoyl-CoA reductase/sulfur reductase-like enzyme
MERHYPYLIVGGGMAGDAAARGIRAIDSDRPVGLIGQEPDPPYNRPPLSKGLWRTSPRPMPLSRIWRQTASLGVELHLARAAVRLDVIARRVWDDAGDAYTYDTLLLATGGSPIRLGPDHDRIVYYRSLADYRRVRFLSEIGQRFAILGGGFIGSEMAAALAGLGKDVTMIFPEPGIGARVLPAEISGFLNGYFRERGVRLLAGRLAARLAADEAGVTVQTDAGETLRVDGVVAGLGIRPNTGLAQAAGLPTGDGILVDAFLRAGPDVYAAGDVVNFHNPLLGRRMRVEHEENANQTGWLAGQAMAGQPAPYELLPAVYSTLFDLSYDAVGELEPRYEVVFDWQEPFRKGAAYYLDQGRVRGVLLWNLPGGLEAARRLIAEPGPWPKAALAGRING